MRFIAILLFAVGCAIGYTIRVKMGEKGPLIESNVIVRDLPSTKLIFEAPQPTKVVFYPIDSVVLPKEVVYVENEVDTVALVKDYLAQRGYTFTLADSVTSDTITFNVQFNRAHDFVWAHHPKLIIEERLYKPSYEFFGYAGVNTNYALEVGAGVFKSKFGLGVGLSTSKDLNLKLYYKF